MNPLRHHPLLLALAVSAAFVSAVAAQTTPRVSPGYRLGPSDRVRVQVEEAPSLSVEAAITAAGTLAVPVLGEVAAAGRTARELADEIAGLLEVDQLVRATVSVEILEIQARTVSVLGAVKNPGSYGYPGGWTLLEAIGAAGGFAADRGNTLRIVRQAENGLSDQLVLPLAELVGRSDSHNNVPIYPEDVIHVEQATKVTIYLLGEVASVGAMEMPTTQGVTLLTAIARAGGLTERASPRIKIKRANADGRLEEISVHYKRILSGRDPDFRLQDGDLIVVEESFF
ncbi:MAG TPA: polysaccharide biosynthesis/export family protein [Thermoanaerobaculia bacterium]|nr:polysaccharide biosynthesis/export family protein [Thermoanaerobaculia bacterium]